MGKQQIPFSNIVRVSFNTITDSLHSFSVPLIFSGITIDLKHSKQQWLSSSKERTTTDVQIFTVFEWCRCYSKGRRCQTNRRTRIPKKAKNINTKDEKKRNRFLNPSPRSNPQKSWRNTGRFRQIGGTYSRTLERKSPIILLRSFCTRTDPVRCCYSETTKNCVGRSKEMYRWKRGWKKVGDGADRSGRDARNGEELEEWRSPRSPSLSLQ